MLYIGADHRGYYLKEQIKKYLDGKKVAYKDMGNAKYEKEDDYADFALKVARAAARRPINRGILICGSGLGMSLAANKVRGTRAAAVASKLQAIAARRDNNANVIALSGDEMTIQRARSVIDAFLATKFSTAKRHRRRLDKVRAIEQGKWGPRKKRS